MKEHKHFLNLLQEHPLLKSIIEYLDFSQVDFNDQIFTKELGDVYNFKNIEVGGHKFKNVEVSVSTLLTTIKMFTDETLFFDDPIPYFGQEGAVFEIESILVDAVPVPIFRRVLRTSTILGRTVKLSIYKLGEFGYTIKLVFPDEAQIDGLVKNLDF